MKLTPTYILAFLILVFLIHELHDWMHVGVARLLCSCWGPRGFDNWEFGPCCTLAPAKQALATLAGPFVNYLFLWIGWKKMDRHHSPSDKSLGISFVFATLPLPRILAALVGGGDETAGLRQLFQHADGGNRHAVAIAGLLIVLGISLPALIRAFFLLPGWMGKSFGLLAFLWIPNWLDHWLVGRKLNEWLLPGGAASDIPAGYHWSLAWLLILLVAGAFTFRYLRSLSRE